MTDKTIFVEIKNNKFINNLLNDNLNLNMIIGNINKNIYELFYKNKFSHLIINASSIDYEIYQFILEYGKHIKIFIYHDYQGFSQNENLDSLVTYLIPEYFEESTTINRDNCIIVPNLLVNNNLFARDQYVEKNNEIAFFLDILDNIPDSLKYKLYPASNLPIKLYNNDTISHYQNLGKISEKDKSFILNRSMYFINYNNYYLHEAIACGCQIIDISNIDLDFAYEPEKKDIINYSNFMKDLI